MKRGKLIIITLVILVLAILSGHGNSLRYSQKHSKGPVVWFVNLMMQKNERAE